MLDSETKLSAASPNHPRVIAWSSSGKAFRIYDTHAFANVVLPKYFRTKKFSSFQRNLNLYGFTKIRRGPDVDMYAHPAFLRDTPETLLQLRKINTGARKHRPTVDVVSIVKQNSRTVSPLSAGHHGDLLLASPPTAEPGSPVPCVPKIIVPRVPQPPPATAYWGNHSSNNNTTTTAYTSAATPILPAVKATDRGKLDLLALAMEHQAAHIH